LPILSIALVAIVVLLLAGTQPPTPTPAQTENRDSNCHLKYGLTEWIPLQYIDDQGEAQGLQIDFVSSILQRMNCKLSFIPIPWNENLAKIKTGEVDFTANATPSDERRQYAYFSIPFHRDTFAVYVRSEDSEKYKMNSLSDLKISQFKLGLTKQYLYGEEVEAWQKDKKHAHLLSYVSAPRDNFVRLFEGEIDGFLEDPFVVAYKLRSGELAKKVTSLPIRTFGHEASFIFSQASVTEDFVTRFNKALQAVKQLPKFQHLWLDP